ncbi:4Fe4S-binding leucine-rich repeat protein [Bradyrhizobium sp. USDA 10063]
MTNDIDEARDWQGNEVDCGAHSHSWLKEVASCRPMDACVNLRYARCVDRFVKYNPALANAYIAHPHFAVQAITAERVNLFLLRSLLDDAEEAVRWNAAPRSPKRHIPRLGSELQIRVASSAESEEAVPMLSDEIVARRISPPLAPRLMHDDAVEVRRVVARRIPYDWLLPARRVTPIQPCRRRWRSNLRPIRSLCCGAIPIGASNYEGARRIRSADLKGLTKNEDRLLQETGRRAGSQPSGKFARE